ncbi:MAG TPA: type VI secretion system ATPase TssH, partial [Candidatus Pygmaiobacter gallistercoris]|nr:type VI secretion system ATPase TssH [Candidatus Pygmaiobacter gallistercoris]
MDLNKLTQKSRQAINDAQSLAIEYQNQQLDQSHLLYALAADGEGLIAQLIAKMGKDPAAVAAAAKAEVEKLPRVTGSGRDPDKIYISSDLDRTFTAAEQTANRMKDEYLSVEHLMLGLFETASSGIGGIFARFGLEKNAFLKALMAVRGNQRVTGEDPEETYDVLKKYGQDLVEAARAHKLDPVIGRDTEIRNVIRILSRKTKNNPVLIGEPGVGKTAIAEGLAERIVAGDVPEGLKNKTVFSLDMGALVAGA